MWSLREIQKRAREKEMRLNKAILDITKTTNIKHYILVEVGNNHQEKTFHLKKDETNSKYNNPKTDPTVFKIENDPDQFINALENYARSLLK